MPRNRCTSFLAACDSSATCSALGNLVVQSAASRNVISFRPFERTNGKRSDDPGVSTEGY
jgi:hypothetical protein